MRILFVLLFCVFVLAPQQTWAQEDDDKDEEEEVDDNQGVSPNTQFLIESIVEDSESEEFDFDTQFEYLEDYSRSPLDLNNADEEELNRFGLLSAIQIQALLRYRKKYGQIFSLYELQGVPTYDLSTISKILPYISVSKSKEKQKMQLGRFFKYSRHQIFARWQRVLERQRGYTEPENPGDNRYLGSPDKLYLRYRLKYRDRLSLGFTAEKDQGEEFFTGSNKQGFDYYSGHFYLKDISKNLHSIAVGDFQVFFGQGLVAWGGFGIRKGAQVLNVKRISLPMRPYTSVNEALFMRGAAAHLQFLDENRLEVTVFGSHRYRDANMEQVVDSLIDDLDAIDISSLQDIGYHRTSSELENENSTQQITAGTRIRYKGDTWHVAGNFVYNYLTNALVRTDPRPYQKFQFQGNQLFNASVDYSFRYKNLQFFGETAINNSLGVATLNSLLADLDPRISLAVLHRYYSPKYHTLTGNAFAESSSPSNEHGLYIGAQSSFGAGVKLSAYFDIFEFPWLRYQTDAPSRGYEMFSKLSYQPSYTISAYAQYRFERKGRNVSGNTTPIDQLLDHDKHNLRFHFKHDVSRQFSLRSRIEFSWYKNQEFNKGFMVYQDIVFSPKAIPLKAQLRLAFFDTDNYDTRIYAYENDVLYAFSVLPYYGQGLRYYLNLRYKVNRNFSIWLRFSQTYFTDREVISSGLGEIDGRTRSELKAQIRVKF